MSAGIREAKGLLGSCSYGRERERDRDTVESIVVSAEAATNENQWESIKGYEPGGSRGFSMTHEFRLTESKVEAMRQVSEASSMYNLVISTTHAQIAKKDKNGSNNSLQRP